MALFERRLPRFERKASEIEALHATFASAGVPDPVEAVQSMIDATAAMKDAERQVVGTLPSFGHARIACLAYLTQFWLVVCAAQSTPGASPTARGLRTNHTPLERAARPPHTGPQVRVGGLLVGAERVCAC